MKKSELKSIIKEVLEEAKVINEAAGNYDYNVLGDAVIDSIFDGGLNIKLLKDWEFGTDVKIGSNTVTGNRTTITFKTPDGDKKVEVVAKLKR